MNFRALQAQPATGRTGDAPALRVRPDERPAWVEAPATAAVRRRWRSAAKQARLPVDAWVALLIEHSLVIEDLAGLGAPVLEQARRLLQTPRLAVGARRRLWMRQLGEGSASEEDELPSLTLPSRLLARIPPNDLPARLRSLEQGDVDAAKLLDLAAVAEGMTMEAWAYRCALNLLRDERGDAAARRPACPSPRPG